MKLEDLEAYKNEEGQVDMEKLNEDIMKETNRSFNKGELKGQEKTLAEFESKSKEEKQVEQVDKTENDKTNEPKKNEELEILRKEIEELKMESKNTKEQSILKGFEKKAKEAGLTDEQIQFYKESSKLDALDNFNFDLVGRKPVEDVGTPTNDNGELDMSKSEKKKELLKMAIKNR